MARRGPSAIALFLGALGILGGVWMAWTGGLELYQYKWRLARDHITTTAVVDDWRVTSMTRRGVTDYDHELRYHFSVPGRPGVYSHRVDNLLPWHENFWVAVPEEVWEDAQDRGTIAVEYLRDDPSVNQPVDRGRGFDAVVVVVVGIVLALIGAVPFLTRRSARLAATNFQQ